MSNRKADLAARAKIATRRTASAAEEDTTATLQRKSPTPRAKPVRMSTDLAPQSYRALLDYCQDLAAAIGAARVPHTEVIRALVDQLETDPDLQQTIAADVTARLRK